MSQTKGGTDTVDVAVDRDAARRRAKRRWGTESGDARPTKPPLLVHDRCPARVKRQRTPWLARGCAILLGAATASCVVPQDVATEDPDTDSRLLSRMISRFPDCELEIQALADIARLAQRYGSDGWFFKPVLVELEQDIVDCATEADGYAVSIAHPGARR